MEQTSTILGLLAQTSIHAGTGQQTGVIDLPIQREGHNGWPCVFGSAVKGALRVRMEQQKVVELKGKNEIGKTNADHFAEAQKSEEVSVVFGPPPRGDEIKHAGALMVTDARLLLFPVRSLTSQFKWATCPAALRRFKADCLRLGVAEPVWDVFDVADSAAASLAVVPEGSVAESLFLEEYRFETKTQDLSGLISSLAGLMETPDAKAQLEKQLVVVSDDSFMHIVNHSTPVNAHISINSETKIVHDGGLWYEETLPPETLLYIGLSATDSRHEKAEMPADQVLGAVTGLFTKKPWLQLGGNETVGMGWCAVKPVTGGV